MQDRVATVHQAFLTRTAAGDLPQGAPPVPGLPADRARAIFRAQCRSRALDRISREMQRAGTGFYTIGSSGHEGMAAVAAALRADDIAFLHYRDAAFQLARADQVPGQTPVWDMALSFACAAEDPISGGRHKVLGSKALMIPPQTSTIASHLPKALGAAYALGLARRHPPQGRALPADGIAVCSFGDASLNHSTAQGAINAAGWTVAQSAPLPLLLICEDNGIGISVPTPKGWVAASMRARPGIRYFAADGCDLYATYAAARDAAEFVRRQRKPAFLHLSTVRLYGHAGADIASSYLPLSAIEADEARDPLLHSVRLLQAAGAMTPDAAREVYHAAEVEARAAADRAASRPHLETAAAVMRSIVPPQRPASPARTPVPKPAPPVAEPLGRHLTRTLHDTLDQYPEVILMGEDIGRKGGVYGITQKLQATFGRDRVMDTLLDEQSILGLAIGLAHNGFIPVPEIQFLAYLHNAEDQLRGEAATLPFFSNGQFANPMVVRIAGLGYQKGFGGHFHNDNALAVLRDIPGLILACPSTGDTAALMLRECVRLAREENRVSVFLEPIALYAERDLHTPGDGAWARPPAGPGSAIGFGDIGVTGDGTDLAIITYGNGHYLSQKAAPALTRAGIGWRIIDLRWLAPLPETALLGAVEQCRSVLVVDECRRSGGVAEGVMALLAERTPLPLARETATDSFIATGPAYAATLPSADSIAVAAKDLLARLS